MHGWDDLVFTHISARVPGPDEHFLINPYGMLFEEITASSLVKVDLAGIQAQAAEVTKGLGGQLVWPGLLRKLDRIDPSYRE
jgi:ribulose-5-phosphate 4-epimerase/fuculose-1-phosphate aldolase